MLRGLHLFAALMLVGGLALSACGGDDSGSTPTDTGTDAGGDADTGGDQGDTSTCGEATACRGNADCTAEEFCSMGCCEPRVVEENCTSQGQACTGDQWTNDQFVCDTGIGECLARCDASTTSSTQTNACQSGSWCFDLNDPNDAVVTPAGDLLDGVCLAGDCNDSCFDPADCPEGVAFSCDDGNGTCFAFGNNANFCIDGGDAEAGDDCDSSSDAPADLCAAGLFCFNGTCVEPCVGDEDCGDDECVPVFDQTGTNAPGLCGQTCDEFSAGQCGADEFCEITVGAFTGEITSWFCVPRELDTTLLGYGDDCDANPDDEDGLSDECGEGLACVPNFSGDARGICEQLCDPDLEGDGAFTFCPAGPGDPLLLGQSDAAVYTTSPGVLGYNAIDAFSDETVQLYKEDTGDGTLLVSNEGVELDAGTAVTALAYLDSTDTVDLLTYLDWDSETTALGGGKAGLRAYNVSDVAWDVFRVDALTDAPLDSGDNTDFASLALGAGGFNLHMFGTTSGYVFERVGTTPDANSSHELVIFERAGTTLPAGDEMLVPLLFDYTDVPDEVTTALSTLAAIRVINASPLFADESSEDPDDDGLDVNYPAGFADVDNLPYGSVSDWEVFQVGENGDTLTVILGDIQDDMGEVIAFESFDVHGVEGLGRLVMGGDLVTLLAWDDGDTNLNVTLVEGLGSPATGEVAVRISNASYDPEVDVGLEQQTALNTAEIASLASLPAADGALDVDPGRLRLAVRTSTEALTGAPTLLSPDWLTLAAGNLLRVVLSNVAASTDTDLWEAVETAVPNLGGLGEGEALLRLIAAADGAGGLRLQFVGEPFQACAPLTIEGLGRCSDRCAPYLDVPSGGDFVPYLDDSGDPTERWLTNGCNHVTGQESGNVLYACLPYITTGDESIQIELPGHPDLDGFCVPRNPTTATGNFGADCAENGDPSCNPDSFCVGLGGGAAECTKLCFPYSGDGPSDCQSPTSCQSAFIVQELGFCFEPDLPEASVGDACTPAQAGSSCGTDDSFCITVGSETACRRLCKTGFGEEVSDGTNTVGWRNTTCPGDNQMCRGDLQFNPPVPTYISVCGPTPQ